MPKEYEKNNECLHSMDKNSRVFFFFFFFSPVAFPFIFIMFPRNNWSLRYGPYGTFNIYKDVNTDIILANFICFATVNHSFTAFVHNPRINEQR